MFGGAESGAGTAVGAAGAVSAGGGEMTTWEDDELDEDDENFLRERARCRLERLQMQQKKTRKRTPRRYKLASLLLDTFGHIERSIVDGADRVQAGRPS